MKEEFYVGTVWEMEIVEFCEQIDAVIIEFSYLNVAPPAVVGCSVK